MGGITIIKKIRSKKDKDKDKDTEEKKEKKDKKEEPPAKVVVKSSGAKNLKELFG